VVSHPDKLFTGLVEWLSGALDANTRTAKVRCSIDNAEKLLKPEMYATASISVAESRALAIPRPALLRMGDQTIVFVQNGTAPDGRLRIERRPVAVDETAEGMFLPITHGLTVGEKIVTSNAVMLLGML
jgi:cobalt-zinc-cadmium efflux system membrane fusion protein